MAPDTKVHGANMRPTWVLSAPDGPHVGPTMNLAIRGAFVWCHYRDVAVQSMIIVSRNMRGPVVKTRQTYGTENELMTIIGRQSIDKACEFSVTCCIPVCHKSMSLIWCNAWLHTEVVWWILSCNHTPHSISIIFEQYIRLKLVNSSQICPKTTS